MLLCQLPVGSPRKRRIRKIRGFMRRVRAHCASGRAYADRIQDDWCNLAHAHLDWMGYGDYSRKARRLFLEEFATRFRIFAAMFIRRGTPFQLWLSIHPYDSGSDAIYFHTPNPHTEFPVSLGGKILWQQPVEHLFSALLPEFSLLEGVTEDGNLLYYAENVGEPL